MVGRRGREGRLVQGSRQLRTAARAARRRRGAGARPNAGGAGAGAAGTLQVLCRHATSSGASMPRSRCRGSISPPTSPATSAPGAGSAAWRRCSASPPLALAGWPAFAPLQAAPAMRIDDAARDEFRSQMIMPLALGGDSGRHMAPTDQAVRLADAPERPRLDLIASLSSGDSFARMLERSGVSQAEAEHVSDMIAGTMRAVGHPAGHAGRHHSRTAPVARPLASARCPELPRPLRPATGGRPRRRPPRAGSAPDPGRYHAAAHPRHRRHEPLYSRRGPPGRRPARCRNTCARSTSKWTSTTFGPATSST